MHAATRSVRPEYPAGAAAPPEGLLTGAARLEEPVYALMRGVGGAMFFCHGLQKIFGLLGGTVLPAGSQLWIGGLIELVTGSLIALGLFARPAAFLASGMMVVAYTQFHWRLAVADGAWLPIVNKGELAVLYALVFLLVACRGGGRFALDAKRRAQPEEDGSPSSR